MATRTQANGVLSIASSQATGNGNKPAPAKPAAVKLKTIIRRLPPGLTQDEFTTILGEDWKLGERYAMNIIKDLNSGCEGWIDWNHWLH